MTTRAADSPPSLPAARVPLPAAPLDAQCTLHTVHRPHVHQIVTHHIWPLGMGGPDVPSNRADMCPTGHMSVHEAMRWIIETGKRPPRSAGFAPTEVALAARGVAEWQAAGKPGNPVLEWHWVSP